MINEVFYSIVIRAALMGLQLILIFFFYAAMTSDWYRTPSSMDALLSDGDITKKKIIQGSVAIVFAFLFSLCFFFIRFLGGY